MFIKEVELENIRSYTHAQIIFSDGTLLFEGDIGSGKTTILMAIEFALFGNSTPAFYRSLLRKGKTQGYVRIKFSHDNKDYEIYRSLLKKGNSIKNDEIYISTLDTKKYLSPVDIQKRFLQILGINIRSGIKKSLPIVTYGIYTPQETMKSVLSGRNEERLGVIRRIFKLDDYRIARDNTGIILKEIDTEIKKSTAWKEEIENIKEDIRSWKEEINKKKKEYSILISTESEKTIECDSLTKEIDEMDKIRKKHLELSTKIEILISTIKEMERSADKKKKEVDKLKEEETRISSLKSAAERYESLKSRADYLKEKIDKLMHLKSELAEYLGHYRTLEKDTSRIQTVKTQISRMERELLDIKEKEDSPESIEQKIGKVEEERNTLSGESKSIEKELNKVKSEIEEYRKLGAICPKCKRPLTEEHKSRLIAESEENMKKLNLRARQIKTEITAKTEELKKIKEELRTHRQLEIRRVKILQDIENLKRNLTELSNKKKEMHEIQEKIKLLDTKIESMKSFKEEYETVGKELKTLERTWREYLILKDRVEHRSEREEELRIMNREIEEKRKELTTITDIRRALKYNEEIHNSQKKRCDKLRVELAEIRERIRNLKAGISEITEKVKEKQKRNSELAERIETTKQMEKVRNWISEKLVPALESIEYIRLGVINDEFRALFEEWFYELLGESDYSATIDEAFTPIIRYESYDMPIDTLSGGERTAVALAYRLALNTMVKRALGIHGNILILDEPTDGFSKDQLYKLKDILDKMETEQIIIVSHEKELRNLADIIYRVEKDSSVSQVRIL